MKTEFDTFRIKLGKETRAREWMQVLRDRKAECIQTLEREKMVLETIFMTEKHGRLYLSWFSIQGDNAESVESSEHEIDKLHGAFWDECVDPGDIMQFLTRAINKDMDSSKKKV